MKISLAQRRFLIVWICVNAFALFVNVAGLEGEISHGRVCYNNNYKVSSIKTFCLFMNKSKDIDETNRTFYPFSTPFTSVHYKTDKYTIDRDYGYAHKGDNIDTYYREGFLGIFNGYSYREFFIYSLLGFVIVFLPKLWSDIR